MAASRGDVDNWIAYAKKRGFTYIISVCDTFDYEDYPVYCNSAKEVQDALPTYSKNMQKINEVIKVGKVVKEGINPYDI